MCLVAWQDGVPVGHGVLKEPKLATPQPVGKEICPEIEDLYVDAAYRRRGVGDRLLEALEDEAADRGYGRVGLAVSVENSAARRLYARRSYLDQGYGEFLISGTVTQADGSVQRWEESCVYLVKDLSP